MDFNDLLSLLQQGEGKHIEFKDARDSVPSSLYETVVSFSNTEGGVILLGVDDEGKVLGIDSSVGSILKKNIITSLNSRDCIDPPVYVEPFTIQHPEGEIMVVQIPASSQVHNYAGSIYVREFECDINITRNQQYISDIYLRKRNSFSEVTIYPQLRLDDLDNRLFDKALTLIHNYKSDHPWLLISKEQLLREATLWRKDYFTGNEGLTLAAALIFGKDETIQNLLPAYKVEGILRSENVDRYDDRIYPPLRTNLIDTYLQLKAFINKHLPEKFYMEGDQRIDLRDKIFREVVGNAIVHREYLSSLATELVISKTELVVTNPNRPYFQGVIDPFKFNPYPKNPNIRKFFTAFGWTDEIGSGVRNTYKYLPLYVPGATPVFIEDHIFKTVIPLRYIHLGMFVSDFTTWLELKHDFSEHLLRGLSTIELPSDAYDKDWDQLLLHLVSSWHQKGTELIDLKWADYQMYEEEELKKVPGWDKKGTQLLKKRNWYLIATLSLSTTPISMSDLLIAFDYKNVKKFRDNYIRPLRNAGLIAFTIPDKPTDPNNKYSITEQGKVFLAGL